MPVFILSEKISFPPPYLAEKNVLMAIGGDLCEERLLLAYKKGIFPWFSEGEPILWWSPDPRLVLYPKDFTVSKSLEKIIKRNIFEITFDKAFCEVINECSLISSENNEGTWLVEDMKIAYKKLHKSGYAHSVEVWHNGKISGGLYGVSLGKCFFGESMFSRISNSSKVALAFLVKRLVDMSFDFIDCQVATRHLISLGAKEIPRIRFLKELKKALDAPTIKGAWG